MINALVALGPLARTLGGMQGDDLWLLMGVGFYAGLFLVAGVVVWFSSRILTRERRAMRKLRKSILRPRFIAFLFLLASPLPAQDAAPYGIKPKGHEENKQLATRAYEGNLKKHADAEHMLVLPGLVADKKMKRVEVMVERTAVGQNAPCEFTLIAETSDHGYEALLISFAKPSDVHRALQFIGTDPGESFDPGSLRYWAKGEPFV